MSERSPLSEASGGGHKEGEKSTYDYRQPTRIWTAQNQTIRLILGDGEAERCKMGKV